MIEGGERQVRCVQTTSSISIPNEHMLYKYMYLRNLRNVKNAPNKQQPVCMHRHEK